MNLTLSVALFALLPCTGQQVGVSLRSAEGIALAASRAQDFIARTLPIADLVGSVELEKQLQVLGQAEDDDAPALLETYLRHRKSVRATADALLQTIRKHAEPPFTLGNDVRLDGLSSLVVTGTPAHGSWVATFLDMQRNKTTLVTMKALAFTLPPEAAAKLGLDGTTKVLNEAELPAFWQKIVTHAEAVIVSRPGVSVRLLMGANLSVLDPQAYIKDYKVTRVFPDDRECAEPIIDILNEGTRWSFRPLKLAPKTYSLVVDYEHTRILEMRQFETTLGESLSTPVTITLPELSKQTMRTQLALDVGQGFVVCHPGRGGDLITFLIVELSNAEEQASPEAPF